MSVLPQTMNTRPSSARLIMAQESVYDFEHKLVSGITVKWQLNPIGFQVKNKSVLSGPVLRSDSVLWQFERYDWMFSHNIVFLRIQLLRTVYDYWTLTLIDVAAELLKKLRNQKRLVPSILEIICLFRVYLVFPLLALESTQDADPAKDGSKS